MSKSIEKARSIIAQSGNSFHCKVLKFLQDEGWTVLISPYYNDNVSSKPREIDLIAEKAFDAKDTWGHYKGSINVKLFIECKYISQMTVFWFHQKDRQKAEELVVNTTPLRSDNSYTAKHHYLADAENIAKLFADEKKQSADYELFYKALNQSLNAMVYYRNGGSIIKIPKGRTSHILRTVNYPVIVCDSFDNLYRVDIGNDTEPVNISDNFQLEVNYAYMTSSGKDRNEYFLIDIVSLELFDKLLNKFASDAGLVSFFLER